MRTITIWIGLVGVMMETLSAVAAFGVPPASQPPAAGIQATTEDAQLRKLLEELGRVGGLANQASDPRQAAAYHLQQADVLARVISHCKVEDRPPWFQQLIDCLHIAGLSNPEQGKDAQDRLARVKEYLVRWMPGHPLIAYATYREMQVDYTCKLGNATGDVNALQEQWRIQLAWFINTFPAAEDVPQALQELGMISELLGKEADAKMSYQNLVQRFPKHALTTKAQGALRRLDLRGQVLRLALPMLGKDDRIDVPFDIDQLRNKIVIVYFWSSLDQQCSQDFGKLKELLEQYGKQGVTLLCVNMDKTPTEAKAFLANTQSPGGVNVFQRGGLDGRLATRLGLTALPTLMLVGKDGKVIHPSIEMGNLDSSIQECLK